MEAVSMRTNLKWFNVLLVALVSCGLYSPVTLAQEEVSDDPALGEIKEAMKADKTGTNPLNFSFDARLYNEYRWLNTKGDGHQNITTAEFKAPFAGGDWQFRGKVRGVDLKADINDDGIDDVNENGMGDTDIRFMTIPYLKSFGVATGVEFFLDTASDDALGAGANSVAPFVFLAFFNPFGAGSLLVPGFQQTWSVDEDAGRSKVNYSLIDLFMVKTFDSNQYWGYIDPQIILDYENNTEYMQLEIQVGMMTDKFFGTKGQSAYIMPSFGVGSDRPYDYSLEIGYKIVW
jgi:hypothetical protein